MPSVEAAPRVEKMSQIDLSFFAHLRITPVWNFFICQLHIGMSINEAMFDIKMGLGNVHFYYSFWYEIILNK